MHAASNEGGDPRANERGINISCYSSSLYKPWGHLWVSSDIQHWFCFCFLVFVFLFGGTCPKKLKGCRGCRHINPFTSFPIPVHPSLHPAVPSISPPSYMFSPPMSSSTLPTACPFCWLTITEGSGQASYMECTTCHFQQQPSHTPYGIVFLWCHILNYHSVSLAQSWARAKSTSNDMLTRKTKAFFHRCKISQKSVHILALAYQYLGY